MSEHKPILSVRISQKMMDRLDAMCAEAGVGRAELVERCLESGLLEEEEWIKMLSSPVKGSFIHAVTNPKVLRMLFALSGGKFEVDPTQQAIRETVAARRRGGKRRVVTKGDEPEGKGAL